MPISSPRKRAGLYQIASMARSACAGSRHARHAGRIGTRERFVLSSATACTGRDVLARVGIPSGSGDGGGEGWNMRNYDFRGFLSARRRYRFGLRVNSVPLAYIFAHNEGHLQKKNYHDPWAVRVLMQGVHMVCLPESGRAKKNDMHTRA